MVPIWSDGASKMSGTSPDWKPLVSASVRGPPPLNFFTTQVTPFAAAQARHSGSIALAVLAEESAQTTRVLLLAAAGAGDAAAPVPDEPPRRCPTTPPRRCPTKMRPMPLLAAAELDPPPVALALALWLAADVAAEVAAEVAGSGIAAAAGTHDEREAYQGGETDLVRF